LHSSIPTNQEHHDTCPASVPWRWPSSWPSLIIFGPKRLPDLGRQLGGGLREFKESITGADRGRELTADPPDPEVARAEQ
jgi:TatA/E family protein of Tat protein translocase